MLTHTCDVVHLHAGVVGLTVLKRRWLWGFIRNFNFLVAGEISVTVVTDIYLNVIYSL